MQWAGPLEFQHGFLQVTAHRIPAQGSCRAQWSPSIRVQGSFGGCPPPQHPHIGIPQGTAPQNPCMEALKSTAPQHPHVGITQGMAVPWNPCMGDLQGTASDHPCVEVPQVTITPDTPMSYRHHCPPASPQVGTLGDAPPSILQGGPLGTVSPRCSHPLLGGGSHRTCPPLCPLWGWASPPYRAGVQDGVQGAVGEGQAAERGEGSGTVDAFAQPLAKQLLSPRSHKTCLTCPAPLRQAAGNACAARGWGPPLRAALGGVGRLLSPPGGQMRGCTHGMGDQELSCHLGSLGHVAAPEP